jgi:hypothetical protein
VTFNTALENRQLLVRPLNQGEFYLEIERYEEAAADHPRHRALPRVKYIYKIYTERGDATGSSAAITTRSPTTRRPFLGRTTPGALRARAVAAEIGMRTEALADLEAPAG